MVVQSIQFFIRDVPGAESAEAIVDVLKQSKGVTYASINWRQGTGDVMFDDAVITAEAILENPVLQKGYRIEVCEDYCSS